MIKTNQWFFFSSRKPAIFIRNDHTLKHGTKNIFYICFLRQLIYVVHYGNVDTFLSHTAQLEYMPLNWELTRSLSHPWCGTQTVSTLSHTASCNMSERSCEVRFFQYKTNSLTLLQLKKVLIRLLVLLKYSGSKQCDYWILISW